MSQKHPVTNIPLSLCMVNDESPEVNKVRVKNYLRENPHASVQELSEQFDLSTRTIQRYLADIKIKTMPPIP